MSTIVGLLFFALLGFGVLMIVVNITRAEANVRKANMYRASIRRYEDARSMLHHTGNLPAADAIAEKAAALKDEAERMPGYGPWPRHWRRDG